MYLICPTAKIVTISQLAQKATQLDIAWWEERDTCKTHAEHVLNNQKSDRARALNFAVEALRNNVYIETLLVELQDAIALMLNQHAWSAIAYDGYTEHQQKTAGIATAFAQAMSMHHVINNETEACEACNTIHPLTADQNQAFIDLLTTLNPPNKQAP